MLLEEVRVRGREQTFDAERRHLLPVGVGRVGHLNQEPLSPHLVGVAVVVAVVFTNDVDLHVVAPALGHLVVAAEVGLAAVGSLHLVVLPQGLDVDVDALRCQLLLLLLQLLVHLPLSPISLLSLQLLGGNGFSGAGLRLGVVGRTTRTFLGVLPLPVLGPPVLEPDLQKTERGKIRHNRCRGEKKIACQKFRCCVFFRIS